MADKLLTVFTPAYNRAYVLERLYQSLVKQTSDDFIWIIVDDGSVDETKNLVTKWRRERKIEIKYYFQKNAGKSQAHNKGVEMADTELFVCVDSDDMLVPQAVEQVKKIWHKVRNAGITGILCSCIQKDRKEKITIWNNRLDRVRYCTLKDAYCKYGLKGDTMLVYRMDLLKKYRFPFFEGETFVPEAYLYDLLDQEGVLYMSGAPLYIVEYLPDGYTASIRKLLRNNPKGYKVYIQQRMRLDTRIRDKAQDMIRYMAIEFVLKDYRMIKTSGNPVLAAVCLFPGWLLYMRYYRKN